MTKTFLKFILAGLLSLVILHCNAQINQPEFNEAFLQDEVATVRIIIPQESIDLILNADSVYSNYEHEATFIYESSQLIDTLEYVGFRLRGNTSRLADKKSFKVSFNTFSPGNRWYGLKKLNLNGEHNDVSVMRSKLCWDMLRDAGLASCRTSYVQLFINEEYKGLYLNVEHINDDFAETRFSEGDGNLYKCTWPANLNFSGSNAADYSNSGYELQTNQWNSNQYDDLAEFITTLNQTSDENLACELPEVFNVREYIKHMAAEVLIGHWDGHIYNKNNFYLYNNAAQGRIEWIPFDLDNTLGIDFLGVNWSNRNLYNWESNEYRPLYERLLENEHWREIYTYELSNLVENYFNPTTFQVKIDQWKDLIGPYIETDLYYGLDYGFSYNDFLESDSEAWGNHVDYSIIEYVELRANSALFQLEEFNELSGVFYLTDSSPIIDESSITISAFTANNLEEVVTLHFSLDGETWIQENMIWSGSHFETEINFTDIDLILEYYVEYDDGVLSYNYPCQTRIIALTPLNSGVLINELMADNESVISDNQGEFEDWCELYSSTNAVWLGNYFLSDEQDFPNKWPIPGFTLGSMDHVLFWCDDDPEQGALHTNFKLNNLGDELFIFSSFQDSFQLVDHIVFEEQEADISYGRNGDGSSDWTYFSSPTPDSQNLFVSISEEETSQFKVYPNPTQDIIFMNSSSTWQIFSGIGSLVLQGNSSQIDLSQLISGVYILKTLDHEIRVIKL